MIICFFQVDHWDFIGRSAPYRLTQPKVELTFFDRREDAVVVHKAEDASPCEIGDVYTVSNRPDKWVCSTCLRVFASSSGQGSHLRRLATAGVCPPYRSGDDSRLILSSATTHATHDSVVVSDTGGSS